MGKDLFILPMPGPKADHTNTLIKFERDEELFEVIEKFLEQKGIDVPRGGISFLNEETNREIDAYGKRLKSVTAGEFWEFFKEKLRDWPNDDVNSAIFDFINGVSSNTVIYFEFE